ncbi:MAG: hypothetical protein NC428_09460 [Clostridium sp.]|nr:hypothetical protein [Clostridium sp.]
MKRLIIPILIMALFLSGCEKKKEIGFVNIVYVMEITLNSDLPIQLLRKIELTDKEREDYNSESPYWDEKNINREIEGFGFPYPNRHSNKSDIYITEVTIYVNKYNILGLTVGDDRKKIDTTMEKFGYTLAFDEESHFGYKKGEFTISFSYGSKPYVSISVYRWSLQDIWIYY